MVVSMDKYYRKRLVPLLLPAMILFIMVILIPFGIGVIYSAGGEELTLPEEIISMMLL